jgi:methyltransferase (TIGR00027 family)
MQVRTRVIDDVLCRFVDGGGRQIVLLGAGYDCRAHRLAGRLEECRLFEVDHPATQAHKRAVLGAAAERPDLYYLPWDFEGRPGQGLPAALAAAGHHAAAPTLTIWEGVAGYLSEAAIDQSVAAVRATSAPGSLFAFTFFAHDAVDRRGVVPRLTQALVARLGEPWRRGWAKGALAAWLAARGLRVARDVSIAEEAERLLPSRWAREVRSPHSRLATVGFEPIASLSR